MVEKTIFVAKNIPRNLVTGAIRRDSSQVVDYNNVVKQHMEYVDTLKKTGYGIVGLDNDPNEPDSIFIEDGILVIGSAIILCNMALRSNELESLRNSLIYRGFSNVHTMPFDVYLDGGDVLKIGMDVFVGISERTSMESIIFLRQICPSYNFYAIKVSDGLHLKSFMSWGGEKTIIMGKSRGAKDARVMIEAAVGDRYKFVEVPDDIASNVIRIGSCLIVQNGYHASLEIIKREFSGSAIFLECDMSELAKVDGALTCCSVVMA